MDPPRSPIAESQKAPCSTQATNPFSSGVVERWAENLHADEGAAGEAIVPSPQQPHGSTETTIPVSSSAFERLLEARPEPDLPRDDPVSSGEDVFPITQLATDHLLCRVLIVGEQGALQVPGAEKLQVRREADSRGGGRKDKANEGGGETGDEKDKQVDGTGEAAEDDPFAECLAVTQGQEDTFCRIESPLHCELYYDSQRDSVQATSDKERLVLIESIPSQEKQDVENADEQQHRTISLERFDQKPLGPGAWRLSSADGLRSLQAIIFPRQHSLALVKLKTLSAIAGTKRDAPPEDGQEAGDDARQEAAGLGPVASSDIIRRLDSLAELSEGQMMQVMNMGAKEYSLFRMSLLGKTSSAQVFQARHSDYPGKLVVVKAFMYASRYNAVLRGRLWKAEYSIHRKLKSDVIVELFGADARLEALIMDNVDAWDLRSGRWCDLKGNKHFLGTQAHAERVLVDMSRALLYLRQKGVVHNDIKPSNILFSESRGAVLIDFGLATVDGSPICTGGTPWYVPGEYLRHARRAAPADVWALGVVVVYLLGHIPLPDSERQVKSWIIRDIQNVARDQRDSLLPPSSSRARMTQWLDIVDGIRDKLLSVDDDLLAFLVASMLLDEARRITAEDLALAASNLTLDTTE